MGRAERRKQERRNRLDEYRTASPHEQTIITKARKDGFTAFDLTKADERGYKRGYEAGLNAAMRSCYAGAALAAKEMFGFGRERVRKLLVSLDNHVIYSLSSEDLINKVFDDLDLMIAFTEPFDRVKDKTNE